MLRPRHRRDARRPAAARRRTARRQRVQLARGAVATDRADARAEDGVEAAVAAAPHREVVVHSKQQRSGAKVASRPAVNAMERLSHVSLLQVAAFAVIAALLAWFARPAPPSVPFADAEALFAAAPPLRRPRALRAPSCAQRWRRGGRRCGAIRRCAAGRRSATERGEPRRPHPWVLSRPQPRREFVLSTPRRGSAPLLRTVPAWEALSAEPATNLTLAQLLGAAPAGGGAHYGSGTLSEADHATGVFESAAGSAHWRSEELMRDLQPLAPLLLADVPAATPAERTAAAAAGSAPPRNRTTLRLWLGGGGVLARTHYDKGHNLFVQLVGRKRVLLWPPSELPALHLYPANHEAFRQSQVPLVREAAAAGGDAARAAGGRRARRALPAVGPSARRRRGWRSWDRAICCTSRRTGRTPSSRSTPPSRSPPSPTRGSRRGGRAPAGSPRRLARSRTTRAAASAAPPRSSSPSPPRAAAAAAAAARLRRRAARLAIRAARRRRRRGRGRGGGAGRVPAQPAASERQAAPQGGGGAQERGALDGVGGGGAAARARRAAGGRTFGAAVARELAGDYAEELAGWASGAAGAATLLRLLAGHGEAELAVGHLLER